MRKIKFVLLSVCLALPLHIRAHEDVDIGIKNVAFDDECRLTITVKNFGVPLPESFYRTVNPAYIHIEKGDAEESLKSLRILDKKKRLLARGGEVAIKSKKTYVNNPAPLVVTTRFVGEYLDYDMANNFNTRYIDCVPGQGQIAGVVPPPTAPDLTIQSARIDPKTCELSVTFVNLNTAALGDYAWEPAGVTIMRLNPETHERGVDVSLRSIDPKREFTRKTQSLVWAGKWVLPGADSMRLGVWQVRGDPNFPNNHLDLPIPEACRSALPRD